MKVCVLEIQCPECKVMHLGVDFEMHKVILKDISEKDDEWDPTEIRSCVYVCPECKVRFIPVINRVVIPDWKSE